MTQSREDEFIENWAGVPREALSEEKLSQALFAYHALRNTTSEMSVDAATGANEDRVARQIRIITAQIPTADGDTDNVVPISSTKGKNKGTTAPNGRKPWAAFAAMAACLALAIGLNLQLGAPQQSDDWGKHVVVRGNTDTDTSEITTHVDNPRKSANALVNQLKQVGATFRSEKKSGSGRQVVFRLNDNPNAELSEQLNSLGVESPDVRHWYVLELAK